MKKRRKHKASQHRSGKSKHADMQWEEGYAQLQEYHAQFGDCIVPAIQADHTHLAEWVSEQRRNRHLLAEDKRRRLDALGFEWKQSDARWEEMFRQLKAFRDRYGHCIVGQSLPEYAQLRQWVRMQRQMAYPADSERRRRLASIGFVWHPRAERWEARFRELKHFHRRYGHCNVPRRWEHNPQLANWVINQRDKRESLDKDRVRRLDALGFEWNRRSTQWQTRFEELKRFKQRFGHCRVPQGWPENPSLGLWVSSQRKRRKMLSARRRRLLDSLGFTWEPLGKVWEERYRELCAFHKRYGHAMVPSNWPENPRLGRWVAGQRRNKRLSHEQRRRLDRLDFAWHSGRSNWEDRLAELADFKGRFGHCRVPQGWPENPVLANWVAYVRHPKRQLPPALVQRLESMGFDWRPADTAWEKNFAALQRFHAQNGHCRVPGSKQQYRRLANWVSQQRRMRARLEPAKIQRLDALNFEWKPLRENWKRNLAKLRRFRKRHGHCDVPYHWQEDPALANWIGGLRSRRDSLPAGQRKELEALGFNWNTHDERWQRRFRELRRFHAGTGNCKVPYNSTEFPGLAVWVQTQRNKRKRLHPRKIALLNSLDFDWHPNSSSWERRFTELEAFRQRFGHTRVPHQWSENPALGAWVSRQRRNRARLAAVRRERLDELGFIWEPDAQRWEANLRALRSYRERFGNCDVPRNWPENPALARWLHGLRSAGAFKALDAERRQQLHDLGFSG